MGNKINKVNKYQEIIQEGISLLKEWINKNKNIQPEETKEISELINEIETENEYSKETYEDIRYLLSQFDNEIIPLHIKRIFNISKMDQYTMFISSRWFETIEDHINLILSTKRFQMNMTKYHYNPVPINETTREFFDHLQTLYLYSNEDERFENDKRIIGREECQIKKYSLYIDQVKQLEEWTGLQCGEVLFDSDKDNWSINSSDLNDRIIGKKQLIFLIETDDGEKFGYYLNTEIIEKYDELIPTDFKSFLFNLQSNGRIKHPRKYEIIEIPCGYYLFDKSQPELLIVGNISMNKKEHKEHCVIKNDMTEFHYDDQYTPSLYRENKLIVFFNPKRILVIQMK